MIIIVTSKPYNIITSIAITRMEESLIGGVQISPVVDENVESGYVLQYSDSRLTPDIIQKLETNAQQLLFDGTSFKVRPFITLSIVEEHGVQQDGTAVLHLNQDYTVKIKYNDPDNVGFDSIFSYIKFKDRTETLDIPHVLNLDSNKEATVTIHSAFPQIAKLRAKDNQYLCYFDPMMVRFKA
jgi:hypothetical protein